MLEPPRILVVDDSLPVRKTLERVFADRGYEVTLAASADDALGRLAEADFDVAVSDILMPGRSGIELVAELRATRPDTPVVLLTAHESVASAVDALRAGAFDYLPKPFDVKELQLSVERALEQRGLAAENRALRRAVERTASMGDLLGESAAMREIYALIRRVARGKSSVLITGESGTGKEVVARTLHFHGAGPERPFVPINCTAMPEGLLESELFGHVRGAFTGANASKRGLFEQAHRGTLFLDEIGDMGPGLQAKLLRVLQDGEVRPVGGVESTRVEVRVIAATHRDLGAEIDAGRFRQDLYYRLNVIPIHIPPLRERPEDVPVLAQAFVHRHAGERSTRRFTPEALERLQREPWPGNARELENLVERALVLSDAERIGPDALPLRPVGSGGDADGGGFRVEDPDAVPLSLPEAARRGLSLRELSDRYIDEVMARSEGCKSEAARALGISRKTLYRRDVSKARE